MAESVGQTAAKKGVLLGVTVMVLAQIVMVAVMTMTPVHMKAHGHGLQAVGLVIGIHIAAMYLPSLVTGILADKLGRTAMSIAAGVVLLAAGSLAAAAPADLMVLLAAALALLGLGWNLGLISGTALLVDATNPATRAKTQGSVDVLIAIAGASGGALSGVVVEQSSYAVLSFAGGILALLLIPVMLWSRRRG
jgi:MFS family permease